MGRIAAILVGVNAALGIATWVTAKHFGRKTVKWVKGDDPPDPQEPSR